NVSWVGPTDIQLGVEPYGGSVVVNYSCTAFKTTIPVIMNYSYRDGRAVYGEVQNVSGIINVVLN
ncbi:hypothetical protein L5593_006754, partial [Pseudomonas aeruginosa]